MTKITNDQSKMDIVAKLVKDGAIDFAEAIKLLEVEAEYISIPVDNPFYIPYPALPWFEVNKVFCNVGDFSNASLTIPGYDTNRPAVTTMMCMSYEDMKRNPLITFTSN